MIPILDAEKFMTLSMNRELIYLMLIFALLVVPRALQRFMVPAPLTCLLFGIGTMLVMGGTT